MTSIPGYGITIDERWTRDIDDAIAVRALGRDGWAVQVSISGVSKYVSKNSPVDLLARERIATRYFPKSTSHMLPRELSEDYASLWPHVKRPVLTVNMLLDAKTDVVWCDVTQRTLVSRARISYAEVPRILEHKENPLHEQMKAAQGLALQLLERRRKSGALAAYDLNNGWFTTEEGALKKIEDKQEVIGHIIVQELMVLANAEVARFVSGRVPVLFRNHEARDGGAHVAELVATLQAACKNAVVNLEQLQQFVHHILKRAEYGVDNLGHVGLQLPAYVHFTSPIRRYADLATHRQVIALIRGEDPPYTRAELAELATHINERAQVVLQLMKEKMKEKANEAAQRPMDARKLESLPAKEFDRVIKVGVRGGHEPSAQLLAAAVKRLEEKTFPTTAMLMIFSENPPSGGWAEVRRMIINHLREYPMLAMSTFAMGQQVAGWPLVHYEVSSEGPAHAKVFTAMGTFMLNGMCHEAAARSRSRKEAEQRAAVRLLASLGDVDKPEFEEPTPEPTPVPKSVQLLATANPIGALQELAQKAKEPLPVYEFEQVGDVFICNCRFRGVEKQGAAGNKSDAKKLAASSVYEVLRNSSA